MCPLGPGIRGKIENFGAGGQFDNRLNVFNRKSPCVPGDIPVQLIEIIEKPDLAVGLIMNGIGMPAPGNTPVFVPNVDADAIGKTFLVIRFGSIVAQDIDNIETDLPGLAALILITGCGELIRSGMKLLKTRLQFLFHCISFQIRQPAH